MKKNLLYSMGALGLCLAAGCVAVGPPKSGVKCNNGANNTCVIEVSVPASSCGSDEIKLEEVVQLHPASNFVEWRLSTGYVFCENDGAFLKPDSPGQDGFKPVGNPKDCASSFTWKREKKDGLAYHYGLLFRSKNSPTPNCQKDPWVMN